MLERLATMDNVIVARSDDRFEVYDQEYGTKPQLYNLTSSVTRFIDRVTSDVGDRARDCARGRLRPGRPAGGLCPAGCARGPQVR